MTIRKRFIIYFGSIFIVVGVLSGYMIWGTNIIDKYLDNDLPRAINDVRNNSKLDVTAQLIRYDDEVLTQSARNYAFTGNKAWKDRYNEFVPKLDLRIKQAIESGDTEDITIFDSINDANLALIDLETQAITLVDNNNLVEAQKILDSEEYAKQKEIYKAGIEKYLVRRGAGLDSASATSTKTIEDSEKYLSLLTSIQKYTLMGFVVLFLIILILLMLLIVKTFMVPLGKFKVAAKEITEGKLETKVDINSTDEIGLFAKDFNKMTVTLKDSIENTEHKIKERTQDLEKLNKYMTGRELKMIELKKRIVELSKNENKK